MVGTRQKETANGEINKDMYISTKEGTSILAYNVGRPCPPICSTGDDFDDLGISIVDKGDDGLIIVWILKPINPQDLPTREVLFYILH